MKLLAVLLLSTFSNASANILDEITTYQKKSVEQIIFNYNLENSLRFDIENDFTKVEAYIEEINKPKAENLGYVDLPGLYVQNPEVTDQDSTKVDIIKFLPDLNTKVKIFKKFPVSPEELEMIANRIKEALLLKSTDQIEYSDKLFGQDEFIEKTKNEFWTHVFKHLLIDGNIIWYALLFFLSSIIYAAFIHSGKVISKGMKDIKLASPSSEKRHVPKPEALTSEASKPPKSDSTSKDNENDFNIELDAVELVKKIEDGIKVNEILTKFYLWKYLPKQEEQLYFNNLIASQSDINEDGKQSVKKHLSRVFGWSEHLNGQVIKPLKPSIEQVHDLDYALAQIEFRENDPHGDKFIEALFPRFGVALDKIIEKYIFSYFDIWYKFFPEKCLSFAELLIEKNPELTTKLSEVLYLESEEKAVNEIALNQLIGELQKLNPKELLTEGKKRINQKVLSLFYAMSDEQINKLNVFDKMDLGTKNNFPNCSWIRSEDSDSLKEFLLEITSEEALYLEKNILPTNDFLLSIDERTKFRFKEKVQAASDEVIVWKEFRKKIEAYFSSPSLENEEHESKQDNANAA